MFGYLFNYVWKNWQGGLKCVNSSVARTLPLNILKAASHWLPLMMQVSHSKSLCLPMETCPPASLSPRLPASVCLSVCLSSHLSIPLSFLDFLCQPHLCLFTTKAIFSQTYQATASMNQPKYLLPHAKILTDTLCLPCHAFHWPLPPCISPTLFLSSRRVDAVGLFPHRYGGWGALAEKRTHTDARFSINSGSVPPFCQPPAPTAHTPVGVQGLTPCRAPRANVKTSLSFFLSPARLFSFCFLSLSLSLARPLLWCAPAKDAWVFDTKTHTHSHSHTHTL